VEPYKSGEKSMSTFKVKLTNANQGLLDVNAQSSGTSIQRTVYIMGPNKMNRKLKDGDTFTDSNYYKRFCYPTATLEDAILEILVDDSAPYSDTNPEDNVFPYSWKDYSLVGGTTYAANTIDILGTTGGNAIFTQVTATVNCKMKINGSANAIIDLLANTTQIFNPGDLTISQLAFDNSVSGASTGLVDILVSVRDISNS
jgi:hypothetical protein